MRSTRIYIRPINCYIIYKWYSKGICIKPSTICIWHRSIPCSHRFWHTTRRDKWRIAKKITTWFHTNKLSLNIKKSNFIIFLSTCKIFNPDNVRININGNEINKWILLIFFGIYIDEHSTYWLFIKENGTKCRNSKQTKTRFPHVHHEYVIAFINITSFTVLYIVMG